MKRVCLQFVFWRVFWGVFVLKSVNILFAVLFYKRYQVCARLIKHVSACGLLLKHSRMKMFSSSQFVLKGPRISNEWFVSSVCSERSSPRMNRVCVQFVLECRGRFFFVFFLFADCSEVVSSNATCLFPSLLQTVNKHALVWKHVLKRPRESNVFANYNNNGSLFWRVLESNTFVFCFVSSLTWRVL